MMPGFGPMMGAAPKRKDPNEKLPDTSEQIIISSLALLKMLKHGRAGVPLEVMGLMLGSFVDEYTTKVVDVFAMPQAGTGVSVEAVDPVFQTNMMQMLKQTERMEDVVGWYHSHPGLGCWLSSTDINTQMSFEQLHPRNVAVVIDSVQSVKGLVVLEAFKLISQQIMMTAQEARQTTSNVGHLRKPPTSALFHGLNKFYFNLVINYRKNENEQKMLLNLYKKKWNAGLIMNTFSKHTKTNERVMKDMAKLAKSYQTWVTDEMKVSFEEFQIQSVGKVDPKRHLGVVGFLTHQVC